MNKNILQAVSGGYDSTYLLIKNLQNGDNVYPIYIHASFLYQMKHLIEYSRVKSLIQKLRKNYKNLHSLTENHISMDNIKNITSVQPIAWILILFSEAKRRRYSVKYDEVHISYIKNDCAISHLPTIRALWKLLFSFSWVPHTVPKLFFPLSKYSKKKIIEKIQDFDKNILASCWTCEKPRIIKKCKGKDNSIDVYIEACGSCQPCKNLIKTKRALFDALKKYKAVFNYKVFRDSCNAKIDELIKNDDIEDINPKYISLKNANKKLIKKL